jgi:hypothetical protein
MNGGLEAFREEAARNDERNKIRMALVAVGNRHCSRCTLATIAPPSRDRICAVCKQEKLEEGRQALKVKKLLRD